MYKLYNAIASEILF